MNSGCFLKQMSKVENYMCNLTPFLRNRLEFNVLEHWTQSLNAFCNILEFWLPSLQRGRPVLQRLGYGWSLPPRTGRANSLLLSGSPRSLYVS